MKLAVLGSINMDMTVTAERIPMKGETLRGDSVSRIPGGKGANQAVAMARLGAEVEMFGCVGDDDNGKLLLRNLQDAGVGTGHIRVLEGVPTGLAMITVAENDNTIVVVPGANGKVDRGYVDSISGELEKFDMLVLQHEIPLETVVYTVKMCHEKKIPVVLNPAPAAPVPEEIVDMVTYLTPNEHEAVLIFGELVITQGSRGVVTCLKSGELLRVPARKSKVADTTGAGDTLNGAFCVRICAGDDIRNALVYANTAAGLSTERFGAQSGMPAAEEVERELGGR